MMTEQYFKIQTIMKTRLISVIRKILLSYAKYVFTLLFLAVISTSCVKEKNRDEGCEDCSCLFDFAHDETAKIIGKWKLKSISINSRMGFSCTDCSPYNVVYEFKQNGALIVSSNSKTNYGWHESGEYSFNKDEWGMGQPLGYPWGLSINKGLTNWYKFSKEKLIIDYSPGDGATYYFVKNVIQ
jgi:hypothetical protein